MIGDFSAQLASAWYSTSWVEVLAAALAVAYLWLAIKQLQACWAAAFVSSCLYVWILFDARLYMESALNAFYAAMAMYGYRQWAGEGSGRRLEISSWPRSRNLAGLAAVVVLSVISSYWLRRLTPAAWPFLDSLTAWASVLATYLVVRKVYENWYWWLAIDTLSAAIYFNRRLYVTMLLFLAYDVMIFIGMRAWRQDAGSAGHAAQHG